MNKLLPLGLLVISLLGTVSADYYYPDSNEGFGGWGNVPEFESQEQIVTEFVAPFLFIVVLLQFSIRKSLAFAFAKDDEYNRPFSRNNEPNVSKEATVMAVAIALMMVASPYWSWIQTFAASIGVIAMTGLVLVFLFLIYLYVKP